MFEFMCDFHLKSAVSREEKIIIIHYYCREYIMLHSIIYKQTMVIFGWMPVTSISVFSGSTLRLFRLKVVVPTGRCSPVTAAATPTPGASIMFTRYRSTAPATARFLSSSLIQSSISKSVIEAGSTRSELARSLSDLKFWLNWPSLQFSSVWEN